VVAASGNGPVAPAPDRPGVSRRPNIGHQHAIGSDLGSVDPGAQCELKSAWYSAKRALVAAISASVG
jgi:hypothetical protein